MKQFNQYCEMAGSCGTMPITGVELLGYRTIMRPDIGGYYQEDDLQLVFTNERGFSQPIYVDESEARYLAAVALNPLHVFTQEIPDPCIAPDTRSRRKIFTDWLIGATVPRNYDICPVSARSTLTGDRYAVKFTPDQLDLGLKEMKRHLFAQVDIGSVITKI